MNPSSGTLVELRANFADEALGSDFSYETYDFGANYYRRLARGVLAFRAFLCKVSERTPLFDLCLYGSGSDLRGYEIGRFRDRAMATAQAEYRFPLAGWLARWCLRAWGKVGALVQRHGQGTRSAQRGLRPALARGQKARSISASTSRAARDDTGLYVYVKESF